MRSILAMAKEALVKTTPYTVDRYSVKGYPLHEPDNRGRNREKKALRIAKAEAKRERKMLKRKSNEL